jgi:hypothetical protein
MPSSAASTRSLEFLRHPLHSILAVVLTGAVCAVAAYGMLPFPALQIGQKIGRITWI